MTPRLHAFSSNPNPKKRDVVANYFVTTDFERVFYSFRM
jgi:hypothetical protein